MKKAIDLAHERVAALLGCEPNEIVFTSGGTESDNTALHSALQMSPERRHIVTTSVEHNAVLNYCEALVRRGCEATIVPVDEQGHLDLAELDARHPARYRGRVGDVGEQRNRRDLSARGNRRAFVAPKAFSFIPTRSRRSGKCRSI